MLQVPEVCSKAGFICTSKQMFSHHMEKNNCSQHFRRQTQQPPVSIQVSLETIINPEDIESHLIYLRCPIYYFCLLLLQTIQHTDSCSCTENNYIYGYVLHGKLPYLLSSLSLFPYLLIWLTKSDHNLYLISRE